MEIKDSAKPYIIGISGGSGSGKTSFVKSLRARFNDEELCVLTLDNYYIPREQQLTDDQGVQNFDLPESINLDEFKRDLRLLIEGKTIHRKEYVFNNEKATPLEVITKPAPIIIVEGLFIFVDKELFDLMDFSAIIHAKDVLKIIRRIQRDQKERNYPIEDVLYRYQHHVLPSYEKFIQPYINQVDVVINNNEHFNAAIEMMAHDIAYRIQSA